MTTPESFVERITRLDVIELAALRIDAIRDRDDATLRMIDDELKRRFARDAREEEER